MYLFDNRNYKLNQTFLKFLGLWPYKKTKFQRLRAICFNALLFSYIIVQLAQFTIVDFHLNVVIRILAEALPTIICFIKFNIFFYDAEVIKQVLERIINDWRIFTDMQEIKIAEYYARQGRQIMIFLILFMSVAVFSYATMVVMPDILDYYLPLNESRMHYLSPVNEYSGCQETYFYPLFLYVMTSIIISTFTLVAVGSTLISIVLHVCAIFKISSYWMEHSVDKEIIACSDRQYVMIEKIIKSVELQRNAQKLIEIYTSSYTLFFFIIISIGVISLSLNLFRLLQAIVYMDNFTEFVTALGFVIGFEIYLFAGNYSGQLIMDHANEPFNAIYKSLWYTAPVSVQRLLLFMMQCSMKGSKLNASSIFVASLEGFTTLSSMSMSYFTVIYSTQQFDK